MKYLRRAVVVDARKAERHEYLETSNGSVLACPGDYILKDSAGFEYPCKEFIFRETYDPLGKSESIIVSWDEHDLENKE